MGRLGARRRELAIFVALLLFAGGLRLAVAEWTFPTMLIGDEGYYVNVATNLAEGRGHVHDGTPRGGAFFAMRPPAHAFLLSLVAAPETRREGHWPASLHRWVLVEVLLGTLVVGATVLLGAALVDLRVGLLAGLLAAVSPTLVAHSHYLWSENLFALLLAGALAGAVRVERAPSGALLVATGILFGLAVLTREVAAPVSAACALWWVAVAPSGERRRAAGRAALLLALVALVVLPWTLRNYCLFGRVVPVTTIGWYALAEGNDFDDPQALKRRFLAIPGDMERMDFARRHALARIRAEQPTWLAEKLVRNVPALLEPDSSLLYKLRRGGYGGVTSGTWHALWAVSLAFLLVVVTGAVLGIAAARGRGRRLLAVGVLGIVLLLHVVSHATPRYRVPWLPLLAVFAAFAALHPRAVAAIGRPGRALVAAVLLVLWLGICLPGALRLAEAGPR